MKPKIKARWIAALRSGEYTQGRGQLRDGDKFCCLGVLCDLHTNLTHKADWEGEYYAGQSRSSLPRIVAEWAGVNDDDPELNDAPASVWNDGTNDEDIKPHSFLEIADLIEAYL